MLHEPGELQKEPGVVYPDSAQKIRQRRLDEAPVAWSVGEDALADYEEGDDLYQPSLPSERRGAY
ncbi:MAG: hypothetical protein IKM62_04920 [Kiritimatiellae bacterium]|nr:hypothetical protein [Kiritimatiellia bacterium]